MASGQFLKKTKVFQKAKVYEEIAYTMRISPSGVEVENSEDPALLPWLPKNSFGWRIQNAQYLQYFKGGDGAIAKLSKLDYTENLVLAVIKYDVKSWDFTNIKMSLDEKKGVVDIMYETVPGQDNPQHPELSAMLLVLPFNGKKNPEDFRYRVNEFNILGEVDPLLREESTQRFPSMYADNAISFQSEEDLYTHSQFGKRLNDFSDHFWGNSFSLKPKIGERPKSGQEKLLAAEGEVLVRHSERLETLLEENRANKKKMEEFHKELSEDMAELTEPVDTLAIELALFEDSLAAIPGPAIVSSNGDPNRRNVESSLDAANTSNLQNEEPVTSRRSEIEKKDEEEALVLSVKKEEIEPFIYPNDEEKEGENDPPMSEEVIEQGKDSTEMKPAIETVPYYPGLEGYDLVKGEIWEKIDYLVVERSLQLEAFARKGAIKVNEKKRQAVDFNAFILAVIAEDRYLEGEETISQVRIVNDVLEIIMGGAENGLELEQSSFVLLPRSGYSSVKFLRNDQTLARFTIQ